MWCASGVLLSSKIVKMRGSGRKSTKSSTKNELISGFLAIFLFYEFSNIWWLCRYCCAVLTFILFRVFIKSTA